MNLSNFSSKVKFGLTLTFFFGLLDDAVVTFCFGVGVVIMADAKLVPASTRAGVFGTVIVLALTLVCGC